MFCRDELLDLFLRNCFVAAHQVPYKRPAAVSLEKARSLLTTVLCQTLWDFFELLLVVVENNVLSQMPLAFKLLVTATGDDVNIQQKALRLLHELADHLLAHDLMLHPHVLDETVP